MVKVGWRCPCSENEVILGQSADKSLRKFEEMDRGVEWYRNNADLETDKKIKAIVEGIRKLSDQEKQLLFVVLQEEENKEDKESTRSLFEEGKFTGYSQAFGWIEDHVEYHPRQSLVKKDVFQDYCAFCESNSLKSIGESNFGKVFHIAFPNVKERRLGGRLNHKYCYSGVRKKADKKAKQKPNSIEEACEAVICEWAEKSFRREFKSLLSVAEFLVSKAFVNPRSKSSLQLSSRLCKQQGQTAPSMQLQLSAVLCGKLELKKKLLEKQNDKLSEKMKQPITQDGVPSAFVPVLSANKNTTDIIQSSPDKPLPLTTTMTMATTTDGTAVSTSASDSLPVLSPTVPSVIIFGHKSSPLVTVRSASVPVDKSMRVGTGLSSSSRNSNMTVANLLKEKRKLQSAAVKESVKNRLVLKSQKHKAGSSASTGSLPTSNVKAVESSGDGLSDSDVHGAEKSVSSTDASKTVISKNKTNPKVLSPRGVKRLSTDTSDTVSSKRLVIDSSKTTAASSEWQDVTTTSHFSILPTDLPCDITFDKELDFLPHTDSSSQDFPDSEDLNSFLFHDTSFVSQHRHSAPLLEMQASDPEHRDPNDDLTLLKNLLTCKDSGCDIDMSFPEKVVSHQENINSHENTCVTFTGNISRNISSHSDTDVSYANSNDSRLGSASSHMDASVSWLETNLSVTSGQSRVQASVSRADSALQNPPMTPVGKFRPVQSPSGDSVPDVVKPFYKETYGDNSTDSDAISTVSSAVQQSAESFIYSKDSDDNSTSAASIMYSLPVSFGDHSCGLGVSSAHSSVTNVYSPVQYDSSPVAPVQVNVEVNRNVPSFYAPLQQSDGRRVGGYEEVYGSSKSCAQQRPISLNLNPQSFSVVESSLSPDSPYSNEVREIFAVSHYTNKWSRDQQMPFTQNSNSREGILGNLLQNKLQTRPQQDRGLHPHWPEKAKRNITQYFDSYNLKASPQLAEVRSCDPVGNMASGINPCVQSGYSYSPVSSPPSYSPYNACNLQVSEASDGIPFGSGNTGSGPYGQHLNQF